MAQKYFPVWPAKEYAALCCVGEWQQYAPKAIPMDSFLTELLPSLKKSGTILGVFPTPSDKAVTPSLDQVEGDIRTELSRIE